MSYRHFHITSFLYDDERTIQRFIAAAEATGFFGEVIPVRRSGSEIRAVAFISKDLDGFSDEDQMAEIAEKLSGILADDIEIVSAWDHPGEHTVREHSRFVKGTCRYVAGEVVRVRGEITA